MKPATPARCSTCGAPAVHAFRPFCSRRCADADLARWLTGVYAIPGGTADADEDGDQVSTQVAPDPHGKDEER